MLVFKVNACCGAGDFISIKNGRIIACGGDLYDTKREEYILQYCGDNIPPKNFIPVPMEDGDWILEDNTFIKTNDVWWRDGEYVIFGSVPTSIITKEE